MAEHVREREEGLPGQDAVVAVHEHELQKASQTCQGMDAVADAAAEPESGCVCTGSSPEPGDDDEDVLLCPICLHTPPLEELALVKGCDHTYCVKCILTWALHKGDDKTWCPQCKKPFSYLITYRALDGSLNDYPVEESVCLLKRALWFQDHLKVLDKGKTPLVQPTHHDDWDEYSHYYDEFDEDQEVEDYYFSSAAGRARVIVGNRRWGDGGYVSSGRRAARPVAPQAGGAKSNKGKGSGAGSATTPRPVQHSASHKKLSHSPSGGSSTAASPAVGSGSKSGGQGRRARRNARRAAFGDYDDED